MNTPIQEVAALAVVACMPKHELREHVDRRLTIETLYATGGNVCRAARRLGVHRNSLTRELAAFGLSHLPKEIRRNNRQLSFQWDPRRPPRSDGKLDHDLITRVIANDRLRGQARNQSALLRIRSARAQMLA